MYVQVELNVLGGLPVTIDAIICGGEVESWNVTYLCGKRLKAHNWVERRICQSGEMVTVEQQIKDEVYN